MNKPWENGISIREVVRRSGVAASALRFYEERGLIASDRAPSTQRRYHRSVLRRIAFIVFAQRIGLSLDQIAAELARLPDGVIPRRHDWATMSVTWTARIDARIAELGRLRDSLTGVALDFARVKLIDVENRDDDRNIADEADLRAGQTAADSRPVFAPGGIPLAGWLALAAAVVVGAIVVKRLF